MPTVTRQIQALQDTTVNPTPSGKGVPTFIWVADVTVVNPDGTVDIQPVTSRASKVTVPVIAGYSPRVGDRVVVTELSGNPQQPFVLAAVTLTDPPPAPFVSPMTAEGDLIVGGTDGTPLRLPVGDDSFVLTVTADGVVTWAPPPVPTGGSGSIAFEQSTPETVWSIAHNLGYYGPPVYVMDTDGDQVIADVTYPSVNTVQINFASPQAGTAYISK